MSEWISVEYKYPNNGDVVLATGLNYGEGPSRHYVVVKYRDSVFYTEDEEAGEYSELSFITHWMPLPEPPK